jgi:hypothetical protein
MAIVHDDQASSLVSVGNKFGADSNIMFIWVLLWAYLSKWFSWGVLRTCLPAILCLYVKRSMRSSQSRLLLLVQKGGLINMAWY